MNTTRDSVVQSRGLGSLVQDTEEAESKATTNTEISRILFGRLSCHE